MQELKDSETAAFSPVKRRIRPEWCYWPVRAPRDAGPEGQSDHGTESGRADSCAGRYASCANACWAASGYPGKLIEVKGVAAIDSVPPAQAARIYNTSI
eukprot:3457591-Rhodomonas_salina.2